MTSGAPVVGFEKKDYLQINLWPINDKDSRGHPLKGPLSRKNSTLWQEKRVFLLRLSMI